MADVNKPKFQLRTGLSVNGDKTPSPNTKLLINHGKPNFTIQRTPKYQNGIVNSTSPTPAANCNVQKTNNNEFVVRSTTFNGVFKPSTISAMAKETLPQKGNTITENEATKVVLRRPKFVQTELRDDKDDENIPEFIRRQRRIQERLANQNILDFENRRSGYFTQVLITPSSPNRKSFVETMASPAVKPGLEIRPPAMQDENIKEEKHINEQDPEQQHEIEVEQVKQDDTVPAKDATLIEQIEEEEVAKAIEEVNKAVEGEDDDKTELEEHAVNSQQENDKNIEPIDVVELTEETKPKDDEIQQETTVLEEPNREASTVPEAAAEKTTEEQETLPQNVVAETDTSTTLIQETIEQSKSNSLIEGEKEEPLQNGHSHNEETLTHEITISHTNGLNGPILPTPDPKGEKGVNFEPKTVVSFAQELGNGDNKYPDTVKVAKDAATTEFDSELKEFTKLKFEINANDQDIEVKPVLATETA